MEFQWYVAKLRGEKEHILGQIGNSDHTLVYCDMPSRMTATAKGAKDVWLLTTCHEHMRFTATLAAQQVEGCRATQNRPKEREVPNQGDYSCK